MFVGLQVVIKPAHHYVGVQCSLLTGTHNISTPKKQVISQIAFSDSDLSDIEVDKQQHNQSYIPSSESFFIVCLVYVT